MITMHKAHNKWQCSRDIDEVQSVFDIPWQDEASRRHEVVYNILRVKFEVFYQNKKFTHVKNEVKFVQIYCDSTFQLVVHVWSLARKKLPPIGCPCLVFSKKKISNCCRSLFDKCLSHVLFHKSNFNLILLIGLNFMTH
jgi:hypothetical protein